MKKIKLIFSLAVFSLCVLSLNAQEQASPAKEAATIAKKSTAEMVSAVGIEEEEKIAQLTEVNESYEMTLMRAKMSKKSQEEMDRVKANVEVVKTKKLKQILSPVEYKKYEAWMNRKNKAETVPAAKKSNVVKRAPAVKK